MPAQPQHRYSWAAIAGTALRFSKAWASASSEKSHKHDFTRIAGAGTVRDRSHLLRRAP